MEDHMLTGLASIILLGIGAQWLAWRLRFPSILFLLIFGFLTGPILGFLNPDVLFGELLHPLVSISVAIILFEGGLTLKLSELHDIGHVIRNLITVGALVTWGIAAVSAHFILNLNWEIAILLGAIVIVTGPTVVGPLLQHVRPVARVANVLKWEGITIDPVGALLAVLVFEGILLEKLHLAGGHIFLGIFKTIVIGSLTGVIFSWFLVFLLKRYLIPDFLHEAVTLMFVIGSFVLSNHFQSESGLLTVTLMGIFLANQKKVTVDHIVHFKENLRVLIISSLFIVLAAQLKPSDLSIINLQSFVFLFILIFVARPLSVFISTYGSELTWQERVFMCWMAPRGIVAAAISSLFGYRLMMNGQPQTEYLVPMTFMVIVGTVTIYGLTAVPVARWLKVARLDDQGVLFIGAHRWARKIAKALQTEGFDVLIVDTNRNNIIASHKEGLNTYYGSILEERVLEGMELDGIGSVLAMTSNNEVNSLAVIKFLRQFGRANVYQLPSEVTDKEKSKEMTDQHQGRHFFNESSTYVQLTESFAKGAVVEKILLTEEFDFKAFQTSSEGKSTPLFVIKDKKNLSVFTVEQPLSPQAGDELICLVSQ